MKKTISLFLMLIFVFCLSGCDTFKHAADSFKTGESTHQHNNHEDDKTETSENLNFKVHDTTVGKSEAETGRESENDNNHKTTTIKSYTTKKSDDPQYPYVDVNDGDTTKYEWPNEGVAAEVPELKSGTMKKPFVSKSTFSVYYANVVPEEFDEYLKTLKKDGFTVDDTVDDYLYIATKGNVKVEYFYDTSKLGNNTLSLVAIYVD